MNRRTFLLATGASACGAMDRSHPPRPARPAAKPPDEVGPRANVDLSLRASQLHANQIAIRGDIPRICFGDAISPCKSRDDGLSRWCAATSPTMLYLPTCSACRASESRSHGRGSTPFGVGVSGPD